MLHIGGSLGGIRTRDQPFVKGSLYPLSYQGTIPSQRIAQLCGRRLAQRPAKPPRPRHARYRDGVTAAAENHGPGPVRFESPRDIRAALLPEEVATFDAAYQGALREASETLSLEALQSTLASWRRIAQMTQADPGAHRRMLQQVERTRRTGEPPEGAVTWEQFRTELGV